MPLMVWPGLWSLVTWPRYNSACAKPATKPLGSIHSTAGVTGVAAAYSPPLRSTVKSLNVMLTLDWVVPVMLC